MIIMKNITRLFSSSYNTSGNICRATMCRSTCNYNYLLSPFMASVITGYYYSSVIEESMKCQNERIIIKLKRLEEKNK